MLINVKMAAIVVILTFMYLINVMLTLNMFLKGYPLEAKFVEHEKAYNLGTSLPGPYCNTMLKSNHLTQTTDGGPMDFKL